MIHVDFDFYLNIRVILRIIFTVDFLRMVCNMILSIRNNEYDCKAMTKVKIEAIVDVVAAILTFIL